MKIRQLLIILFLMSPYMIYAQENVNYPQAGTSAGDDFVENVIKKVQGYNIEIDRLSDALNKARENKSKDTVTIRAERKIVVEKCFQVPQDYIKVNPSSQFSHQALGMLGDGGKGSPVTVSDLESLFNLLPLAIKESADGKAYLARLAAWKERDKKKN